MKFTNRIKLTVLKGMEAIGTSASNMASNAKFKVQEINLEARKREILTEFSMAAFELWQNGETLPAPLDTMLKELRDVDERLSIVRAQKVAHVEEPPEFSMEVAAEESTGEETDAETPVLADVLPTAEAEDLAPCPEPPECGSAPESETWAEEALRQEP